jgi:hypothetical protein
LRSPFVTKWHSFIAEDAPTRDSFLGYFERDLA